MAEDIRKKGGIGSGNTSTPATTSSNASGAGYGYAPLYESLAQMANFGSSADMFAAANADSASTGAATTSPTNNPLTYTDDELSRMTVAEQQAAAASYNPTTVGGIDVEKALLGSGVSMLANTLLPAGFGLPGLVASYLAKQALQNHRDINQNSIEGYLKGTNPSFGETGGVNPMEEGIKPITEAAVYTGPKVAEDSDPLGTWIAQNIYGQSSSSTPSYGTINTGAGSGFDSSTWGNSSTSGSSGSSTGGYSSDGSTSDSSGMSGGTGGSF